MKKIFLFIAVILILAACKKNLVSTPLTAGSSDEIKIGKQRWAAKNLNVTHYRNGDKIPQVKDSAKWVSLTTGAWCYFNNDPVNGPIYGKLYNWYAVHDPRGLAPEGWHIPRDVEWMQLSAFLGGDEVAGGKMKEIGISHWLDPNTGATNSSRFTALPGGDREYFSGSFYPLGLGWVGTWWGSSEVSPLHAMSIQLGCDTDLLSFFDKVKNAGCSVRCVRGD